MWKEWRLHDIPGANGFHRTAEEMKVYRYGM